MKFDQSLFVSLGKYGCYFLCLIHLAQEVTKKNYDIMTVLYICIKKGYIKFNEQDYDDENNFFVNNPDLILKLLTGKNWSVKKETPDYQKKDGEYIAYFWRKPGQKEGHFILDNYNGLQHSVSVEEGRLESIRVFKEV